MAIRIHPATAERWDDLASLFGPRGACEGCWCMWWRVDRKTWDAGRRAGNRKALRRLVEDGTVPGLLAYDGEVPVGWVALAPREDYPRLDRSRNLARVDDAAVWSITCFFVAKDRRGEGLTRRLLAAAVDHVRAHGGRIVEGYPVDPAGPKTDTSVYTGLLSTFEAAGFREVVRRAKARPVVRKRVRPR